MAATRSAMLQGRLVPERLAVERVLVMAPEGKSGGVCTDIHRYITKDKTTPGDGRVRVIVLPTPDAKLAVGYIPLQLIVSMVQTTTPRVVNPPRCLLPLHALRSEKSAGPFVVWQELPRFSAPPADVAISPEARAVALLYAACANVASVLKASPTGPASACKWGQLVRSYLHTACSGATAVTVADSDRDAAAVARRGWADRGVVRMKVLANNSNSIPKKNLTATSAFVDPYDLDVSGMETFTGQTTRILRISTPPELVRQQELQEMLGGVALRALAWTTSIPIQSGSFNTASWGMDNTYTGTRSVYRVRKAFELIDVLERRDERLQLQRLHDFFATNPHTEFMALYIDAASNPLYCVQRRMNLAARQVLRYSPRCRFEYVIVSLLADSIDGPANTSVVVLRYWDLCAMAASLFLDRANATSSRKDYQLAVRAMNPPQGTLAPPPGKTGAHTVLHAYARAQLALYGGGSGGGSVVTPMMRGKPAPLPPFGAMPFDQHFTAESADVLTKDVETLRKIVNTEANAPHLLGNPFFVLAFIAETFPDLAQNSYEWFPAWWPRASKCFPK